MISNFPLKFRPSRTLSSLEGLTRTTTSDLPVRLGSCVLSVLRGTGPHAALEIPPWECIVYLYRLSPDTWLVIG